ncbi:MAG TPA: hydrogenase maturation nickel metallochaperone HypA [Bacteroidales bacterium]|nr:hydrogenase maturation nickel metallochaperone HypA [Bacteroidales bacterium]HSA42411.1 hydrogenase maturation nickel metallochaperone HypA [Bacteroidales bacterium]
MHELTIAAEIADLVTENAMKEGVLLVTAVHIEVGAFSGVDVDSLAFALELSVKDTIMEKAVIQITRVSGEAECRACGTVFALEDLFMASCPGCGSTGFHLLSGRQLRLLSVEISS